MLPDRRRYALTMHQDGDSLPGELRLVSLNVCLCMPDCSPPCADMTHPASSSMLKCAQRLTLF